MGNWQRQVLDGGDQPPLSSHHPSGPSAASASSSSAAGGGGGGSSGVPRMSSDVGASRIWNRLLDAAFDNSDRRKHGMGVVGRLVGGRGGRRRAVRRQPESNRKRKLGGNAADHRPYFTYWITLVQILVLFISMLVYGVGPVGVDLYKKAGMVRAFNRSPSAYVFPITPLISCVPNEQMAWNSSQAFFLSR